jgi:hypothetical protein
MKIFKFNLLICFLLVWSESTIAQVSTILDGKSFSVNLIPSGKNQDTSWKTDTFIFDSGEMYPQAMKKREGFKRAAYSTTSIGTEQEQLIKFIYEKNNKYGSSLKIEGTTTVDSIEGTAIWTDDNGEHTYNFTGSLVITTK